MRETAWSLAASVRTGKRSATDIVRETLGRLTQRDSGLNAFVSTLPESAMLTASRIDAARQRGESLGPLAGVPIAAKDNLCTTEGKTTCGSRILSNYYAPYEATVVQRLAHAGAVLIGKTNLDEFAMGSSTENSAFFTTRNPWNSRCVAGGSSGGSAAAVSAALVAAALGSDTGGSVRLPASFCGVVGLKPTYGRVSRYGLVAFGSSLDQVGVLSLDARDAALILSVIAGHDPRDSTSATQPVPDYGTLLDRPLHGLRIGVSEEYFGPGLNEEVRKAVEAAIGVLKSRGAETTSIHLPHMKYGVACYYVVSSAEASSNLARFDGVHYGHRTARPKDALDVYFSSRGEGLGAEAKRRIMLGTYALSSGYYDAYYLKALKVRRLMKQDFDRAFESVDVIASPVSPTTAFAIGEKANDPLAMYLGDLYTLSANLAGHCAISLPCGFDRAGLPIGLQLMGPPYREETLLSVAHQYQQLTDYHLQEPSLIAA